MTIFTTALKRILTQPLNWVFILLFPVMFCALMLFVSDNTSFDESGDTQAFTFGVVDQDQSALSQALVKQLEMRYAVREGTESNISAALTDSEVPWILLIPEGYGRDVLIGRSPALEGYSLTISDVSALCGVTTENITRALMLLGTDDPAALAAWEDASRVDVMTVGSENKWESNVAPWLGFFGFVSLFTAYFIIRTLQDDKRRGMPERLGVLPKPPRILLIQTTLAAFIATEITAALLLAAIRLLQG